jgi:hypothetical protein
VVYLNPVAAVTVSTTVDSTGVANVEVIMIKDPEMNRHRCLQAAMSGVKSSMARPFRC